MCAEVLGAFAEEVSRSLRWRAKRLLALKSVERWVEVATRLGAIARLLAKHYRRHARPCTRGPPRQVS